MRLPGMTDAVGLQAMCSSGVTDAGGGGGGVFAGRGLYSQSDAIAWHDRRCRALLLRAEEQRQRDLRAPHSRHAM